MKPLITMDEPTTCALQWLESNVKGPLLTICRAIFERDSQALESVCTEYFAGDFAKSEALSLECNRQLAALQLGEALRTGYAHSRASNRNRSGFVLICDARRTILYVMKDFDKNIVIITGQVRQEQELAVHTIETIKQALVEAVEARLSMC